MQQVGATSCKAPNVAFVWPTLLNILQHDPTMLHPFELQSTTSANARNVTQTIFSQHSLLAISEFQKVKIELNQIEWNGIITRKSTSKLVNMPSFRIDPSGTTWQTLIRYFSMEWGTGRPSLYTKVSNFSAFQKLAIQFLTDQSCWNLLNLMCSFLWWGQFIQFD